MILLTGDCFNVLYLKLLKIAISGSIRYQNSRVGSVINLGQAYLEIMPNDPRLIFLNHRKINPVFAIIEGAWLLSGDNKLNPLSNELPNFSEYSDDGETLNGAYGNRLINYFGFNQLDAAIDSLKMSDLSRRVVLTMYSPSDLNRSSKDIPCNTQIYLKVIDGALDITVLNRSNDIYLGLPYNVFVFGLLQKYIANKLELPIGIQRHFSDCFHLYEKNIDQTNLIVQNNSHYATSVASRKFNWEFSDAIVENFQQILSNEYDFINEPFLAEFLKLFNRKGRLGLKDSNDPIFLDSFYGFLAYQCYPQIGFQVDGYKLWGDLSNSMMNIEMRQKFEQLSRSSSEEIANNIKGLSAQLKGQFNHLKQILDNKSGPFAFKNHENEEVSLHALLLCLVWTTLDPYTANTSIGTKRKAEIESASSLLAVPASDIGPLCILEDELFKALDNLLGE